MAWIESHQSLLTHRKLLGAASILHCDKFKLMGHLHALWYWALDNAGDGDLSSIDDGVIAIAAGWPVRRAPDFVAALTSVGFIDPNPRQLHDWGDYAGKLADRRKRNRERMREARATSVQDTCKATVPNRTEPYSTVQNLNPPIVPPRGDRGFGRRSRSPQILGTTPRNVSLAGRYKDKVQR